MAFSAKASLATAIGRSSYWFLHTFLKGGSSLPGQIANRIDPQVLRTLGQNYDVIVVTGTNGKTLTTSLIVKVLKKKYKEVLTNPTGSNMLQGITTAFLAQPKRGHGRGIAVLEVDEANVAPVAAQLKPKAFVLTNIFRDQMDRYGEFYTTYQKILDGVTPILKQWSLLMATLRFSAPESCLIQSPTMALNSRQMAIIKPRRIRTVSCVRYVSTFCTTMHKLTPIWAIIFVRIAASNAPL